MKRYMVKTRDHGKLEKRYYVTLERAMVFFNACGSAALYEYDEATAHYEFRDAK